MKAQTYRYIIVGAGLAGASAVDGIRTQDREGTILLIGDEPHPPYNRPPLSKKLWFGKTTVEKIFLHPPAYYTEQHVELITGVAIIGIDAAAHTVTDARGLTYGYEKLLLATGGTPRRLAIPGGDLDGISYYRSLRDFETLHPQATEGKSALIIGGGFIGTEIAAALRINKLAVTMLYPDETLVSRVFPADLGHALQEVYRAKGVRLITGDTAVAITRRGDQYVTQTRNGAELTSDLLIVGIGIAPALELARLAGVETGNGIEVNAFLQTADHDIYAAGDVAHFPYQALGQRLRIEHWDNALNQGAAAGRNMAVAADPYTYMPYFFSDLFEFGYEAVGDVSTKLLTIADWQTPYDTGVIYYMQDNRVRGVMMCNLWDKVDAARALIRANEPVNPDDLRGRLS